MAYSKTKLIFMLYGHTHFSGDNILIDFKGQSFIKQLLESANKILVKISIHSWAENVYVFKE